MKTKAHRSLAIATKLLYEGGAFLSQLILSKAEEEVPPLGHVIDIRKVCKLLFSNQGNSSISSSPSMLPCREMDVSTVVYASDSQANWKKVQQHFKKSTLTIGASASIFSSENCILKAVNNR